MRDDLVLLGRTLATSMQSPSGFGMEMIESELKRDAKKEDSPPIVFYDYITRRAHVQARRAAAVILPRRNIHFIVLPVWSRWYIICK